MDKTPNSQSPQGQQAAPAHSSSPFGTITFGSSSSEKKSAAPPVDLGPIHEQINTSTRRLRVLEERYSTLQKKSQLSDQNMLAGNKKIGAELKTINEELTDLKTEISKLKDTITLIIQELKESAKKDDIIVLDKYLKLWEPVKFVTANQVERIVREIVAEELAKQGEGNQDKAEERSPAKKTSTLVRKLS